MIFESHAHYDDKRFDEDRHQLLAQLPKEGIQYVLNVAADIPSAHVTVDLAKQYDYIYGAVGVHPHDVKDMKEEDLEVIKNLAAYDKIVAIGEIGLDYYYDFSPKEAQRLWFRKQVELAKEINLPVIIHSRDAAQDTFDILDETDAKMVGGVIHCYSGSLPMARAYVENGFYIGIGGVITFKNAAKLKEVVKHIAIDHLLIETDSPYMAPVPHRGKRNDSRNLKYIAEEIGKIKGLTALEVIQCTNVNACKLFGMQSSV
ncbi:TatD family hydrolase [Vallitalea pronyensis]|uniref:TatD family hydrolase n=1 Tax=Vallitalea pronyensis TaxID=1348613 RepID=A0A8J8SJI2_9FIRM|nr:TatD family hydrolase [Vallitalea pronyensis]QUI25559.1 TatD family hydrolase [Vallitalea pronyensis]